MRGSGSCWPTRRPGGCSIFGRRRPRAGRCWKSFATTPLHEAVTTAWRRAQPQRLETQRERIRTAMRVDIHVQPLPGEPCPGVVLVMHDTTELRRLESLRRDFVANVSHELKTPLSSIKAYTETLRNGAMHDPETSQKFLGRIEEQTERLHRLIMDMLMLARIESDQQAFEIVPVDVAERRRQSCLDDHRQAADAKRITLVGRADRPQPATAVPRAGRSRRPARNSRQPDRQRDQVHARGRQRDGELAERGARSEERDSSATRAPSSGSPQPRVVSISVRDTGIGIKPEDQERVFERFYRVDKARSRELGGTGLGLAIVKHLAQSFGGKVGVESEAGQGQHVHGRAAVARVTNSRSADQMRKTPPRYFAHLMRFGHMHLGCERSLIRRPRVNRFWLGPNGH